MSAAAKLSGVAPYARAGPRRERVGSRWPGRSVLLALPSGIQFSKRARIQSEIVSRKPSTKAFSSIPYSAGDPVVAAWKR